MIKQINEQNEVIKTKLAQKKISDFLISEILLLEDHLAKIAAEKEETQFDEIKNIFPWVVDIKTFQLPLFETQANNILQNNSVSMSTEFMDGQLEFLSLLPLINATKNLPNRVFYGSAISKNEGIDMLPFSVTNKSSEGQFINVIGWINLTKFFKTVLLQTNLHDELYLMITPTQQQPNDLSIINVQSPSLSIQVSKIYSTSKTLSSYFSDLTNNPQSFLLMVVNILLWVAITLTFFEHIKRLRSEERLKDAIDKGLQQAKLASIGEMASGLAHEINQPLATIETYAGIIQKSVKNKKNSKTFTVEFGYIQEIRNQTQRCSEIIRSVLSLKPNNNIDLNWQKLQDLRQDIEPILNLNAKKNSAKVIWQINNNAVIYSNNIALQQILINISLNGLEAMQNTDFENRILHISSTQTSINRRDYVSLSISDRGCGIHPQVASKIFSPFTSFKQDGIGLGLSLCKSLSEKCNIMIDYSPNEFGGTTFKLLVPAFSDNFSTSSISSDIENSENSLMIGTASK